MPLMKVKKGDTVQMLTGKDRGKQGRVIDARPSERKVIVPLAVSPWPFAGSSGRSLESITPRTNRR